MKITDWPYEFPSTYWLDEKEDKAVLDVLRSGALFRYYGLKKPKYVDLFEQKARKFYGCEFALAVNSGTGALITAISALGVGPGCELIVPAYMWVATVSAVIQCNAIPVLCEVDDSFGMDPCDLEKKITSRTKLILPIHMSGAPCDMESIMSVAKKHNLAVLEDCAQCNGGTFKGRKVGTFGDMGIFSLQVNKNITSGEGGLIITNDEKLYNRAFGIHDMGVIRVDGRLAEPEPYALTWGTGRRMSELCGAVASVQIDKLPEVISKMKNSKNKIKAMLKGVEGLEFRRINDEQGDTGPALTLILDNQDKAKNAVKKMNESGLHNAHRVAEFGYHIYYNVKPLVNKIAISPAGNPWKLRENAESNYKYDKGNCPRSDELFSRSIVLAIPSVLTEEQEIQAVKVIKAAIG